MQPFRLITWNVASPPIVGRDLEKRLATIAIEVQKRSPDVATFQEVGTVAAKRKLDKMLEVQFEPVDGVPSKRIAPWWLPVVGQVPFWIPTVGFINPWSRIRKGAGLLTYIRRDSPWRIDEVGFISYQAEAPPIRITEGDGYGDKGIQRMLLRHKSGIRLALLNTHLQAQYPAKQRFYTDIRHRQVLELNAVAATVPKDIPILAVGDFNTAPEEVSLKGCNTPCDVPVYNEIIRFWHDLIDQERKHALGDVTFTGSPSDPHDGPQWLDYILLARHSSKLVELSSVETTDNAGSGSASARISDHKGLSATMLVSERPAGGSVEARFLAIGLMASLRPTRREFFYLPFLLLADLEPSVPNLFSTSPNQKTLAAD